MQFFVNASASPEAHGNGHFSARRAGMIKNMLAEILRAAVVAHLGLPPRRSCG
jgi:hypothetical protein